MCPRQRSFSYPRQGHGVDRHIMYKMQKGSHRMGARRSESPKEKNLGCASCQGGAGNWGSRERVPPAEVRSCGLQQYAVRSVSVSAASYDVMWWNADFPHCTVQPTQYIAAASQRGRQRRLFVVQRSVENDENCTTPHQDVRDDEEDASSPHKFAAPYACVRFCSRLVTIGCIVLRRHPDDHIAPDPDAKSCQTHHPTGTREALHRL